MTELVSRMPVRTDFRECEDQNGFKVQAVPEFRFDWCKVFACPGGTRTPGLPLE
jgi:hypothetical protein